MLNNKLRMKDACARTGLTERAVRLYIEKGLLHPWQEEQNDRVLTFFSEEDIARLEDIAVLRKAGFSIDSIVTMTKYPQTIGDIVKEQLEKTAKEAEESRAVSELLQNAAKENCRTVHELCTALNREPMHSIPVPHADSEPDFSKFEDATEQERLDGIVDHVITQRAIEKRARRRKTCLHLAATAACLVLLFCIINGLSYIPRHISRTYDCIQYEFFSYKQEPYEIYADVRLTVDGNFYYPLLEHPYFSGDITIEQIGDVTPGHELPNLGEKYGYTLKDFELSRSKMIYVDESGNEFVLGLLDLYDDDMDYFRIVMQEQERINDFTIKVTETYIVPNTGEEPLPLYFFN